MLLSLTIGKSISCTATNGNDDSKNTAVVCCVDGPPVHVSATRTPSHTKTTTTTKNDGKFIKKHIFRNHLPFLSLLWDVYFVCVYSPWTTATVLILSLFLTVTCVCALSILSGINCCCWFYYTNRERERSVCSAHFSVTQRPNTCDKLLIVNHQRHTFFRFQFE